MLKASVWSFVLAVKMQPTKSDDNQPGLYTASSPGSSLQC